MRILPMLLLILIPVGARGQTLIGGRVGGANGPGSPKMVGVGVEVPVWVHVRVTGGLEQYASFASCAQTWPGSLKCGYHGWLAEVGLAVAAVETERVYLEVVGNRGVFSRGGFGGSPHQGTWSAGGEAGLHLSRHCWAQAGFSWLWVKDGMYRDLFGTYPALRTVKVGIAVAL